MRRFRIIRIFLFVFLFVLLVGGVGFGELLVEGDYYTKVHDCLLGAQDSIVVVMYFVIIDKDGSGPVSVLVDDLIAASKRGVDVRVILEDSRSNASRSAYTLLKKNGIDVSFDMPRNLLHVKGVSVDDRYLFIGSANWSDAALTKNYEVSYLVDSPDAVKKFKEYVETIPVTQGEYFLPQKGGVPIHSDFILLPKQGRELLQSQGDKQLDLYLLLCKMQEEKGTSRFDIDYERLAKELGYTAPENLGKYRNVHHYFYERVHRILKKLRKHGLIEYRKGNVALIANSASKKNNQYIILPSDYWEKGYADTLSMRAKYLYLIAVYEANRSTRYPVWFRSQEDMAKLYGISDTTISLGLMELESRGLIEITRDPPTPPDFKKRKANIYKILPFTE